MLVGGTSEVLKNELNSDIVRDYWSWFCSSGHSVLLFHFGTENQALDNSFAEFSKQMIIYEIKWRLAVLLAKMSWFTSYITDIYFLIISTFFEDWIEALNLRRVVVILITVCL